jgi:hypothetical protein
MPIVISTFISDIGIKPGAYQLISHMPLSPKKVVTPLPGHLSEVPVPPSTEF